MPMQMKREQYKAIRQIAKNLVQKDPALAKRRKHAEQLFRIQLVQMAKHDIRQNPVAFVFAAGKAVRLEVAAGVPDDAALGVKITDLVVTEEMEKALGFGVGDMFTFLDDPEGQDDQPPAGVTMESMTRAAVKYLLDSIDVVEKLDRDVQR